MPPQIAAAVPQTSAADQSRRTLFTSVFEAEKSLLALSLSIFFAVSSRFRRHFMMFNLCILAPVFILITVCLSGWVAVFAAVGHVFIANEHWLPHRSVV